MRKIALLLFFVVFLLSPCGLYEPVPAQARSVVVTASWYGPGFEGSPMANGKPFKAKDPTIAAHPTLRFGTKIYLKNPDNGRRWVVEVKDRGPFIEGRELDLSKAAAKKLGYVKKGVTKLIVVALK